MKTKESTGDEVIYTLACILTLGIAWVLRVVISKAIRNAFMTDKEESIANNKKT